jgi:4-amino-4-deoxychorismate lyase
VARYAWPDYPEDNWRKGVRIRMCATTLGLNPALAGLKHCNRLEQVLARGEWKSSEIAEGLMMDINDNVIEGTMSNIFIVKDTKLKTPALDMCGVEGVMRSVLLDTAKDQIIPVSVDKVSVEDVVDADELFLTNSLIGIWPVRQFEDKTYEVGPITRQLNKNLVDK